MVVYCKVKRLFLTAVGFPVHNHLVHVCPMSTVLFSRICKNRFHTLVIVQFFHECFPKLYCSGLIHKRQWLPAGPSLQSPAAPVWLLDMKVTVHAYLDAACMCVLTYTFQAWYPVSTLGEHHECWNGKSHVLSQEDSPTNIFTIFQQI